MKLKNLIKGLSLKVKGSKEIEVLGLQNDSRKVGYKELFFAKKGESYDGNEFIQAAIDSGASVVVSDCYNPFIQATQIITEEISSLEPLLAARFYQNPSKKLSLVGITGTNGKTTTSYLLKQLLEEKAPCGLMGTIEYSFKEHQIPASLTTADILTNQKMLDQMVKAGCKFCVMEVTSHALSQNRVKDLSFDLAIFTNLTEEHLDYHKTMEAYAKAKLQLFCSLSEKAKALVNLEDPFSQEIISTTKAKVFTYSLENPQADFFIQDIYFAEGKTHFSLKHKKDLYSLQTSLVGSYNLVNLLAAIAAAYLQGMPWKEIVAKVASLTSAPGRLEKVENERGLSLFVDFAHTEDALLKVLKTLRRIALQKIITVFGCGGNRDPFKRPKMAKVAESFSDIVIVTNDNPRKENPEQIAEQIEKGFSEKACFYRILDRKEAFKKALCLAQKGDIVLFAGRGHEKRQLIGGQSFAFEDKKVIEELLQEEF